MAMYAVAIYIAFFMGFIATGATILATYLAIRNELTYSLQRLLSTITTVAGVVGTVAYLVSYNLQGVL